MKVVINTYILFICSVNTHSIVSHSYLVVHLYLPLLVSFYTPCSCLRQQTRSLKGSQTLQLLVGFSPQGALAQVEREQKREMECLSCFPESWLQLGSLLDQRSLPTLALCASTPSPSTPARFHQLLFLYFFGLQDCPVGYAVTSLRECSISYGFSICFANSTFIKLFSNYRGCVFHIFLTWPLIDILIECYYTGKPTVINSLKVAQLLAQNLSYFIIKVLKRCTYFSFVSKMDLWVFFFQVIHQSIKGR